MSHQFLHESIINSMMKAFPCQLADKLAELADPCRLILFL